MSTLTFNYCTCYNTTFAVHDFLLLLLYQVTQQQHNKTSFFFLLNLPYFSIKEKCKIKITKIESRKRNWKCKEWYIRKQMIYLFLHNEYNM